MQLFVRCPGWLQSLSPRGGRCGPGNTAFSELPSLAEHPVGRRAAGVDRGDLLPKLLRSMGVGLTGDSGDSGQRGGAINRKDVCDLTGWDSLPLQTAKPGVWRSV